MEDIVQLLKESIEDDFLSKAERKSLREYIAEKPVDEHQLNFCEVKSMSLPLKK
jgi:hypothetical protein